MVKMPDLQKRQETQRGSIDVSIRKAFGFTVEVIPEFSGVGQGLDDAVHEAGVTEVDQSGKAGQAHLLLLLFFVPLIGGGSGVGHGLHHAGRFRLRHTKDSNTDTKTQPDNCSHIVTHTVTKTTAV